MKTKTYAIQMKCFSIKMKIILYKQNLYNENEKLNNTNEIYIILMNKYMYTMQMKKIIKYE